MSITKEHAEQLKNKPAVVCCRKVKGTVLNPADLEDPSIFDDLQDSGLITIPPDVLPIGAVVGTTLTKDVDALTALTIDMLEGVTVPKAVSAASPAAKIPEQSSPGLQPAALDGMLHIRAEQVTGLDLSIPLGVFSGAAPALGSFAPAQESSQADKVYDEVISTLEQRHYTVKEVKLGEETTFINGVLTVCKETAKAAMDAHPLVKKLEMEVITPDKRHVHSDTIMDVVPIAVKVEGEIGSGISHILDNVVFVLTGIDEDGKTQVHEFGSSDGFMDETIVYQPVEKVLV